MPRFSVVTLCGSTKFKDEFMSEQKRLTLDGHIVISVGLFGHSGDLDESEVIKGNAVKDMLDDMHFSKIGMADSIHVINKNGYIGESTRLEIQHAKQLGLPITYMEPEGARS